MPLTGYQSQHIIHVMKIETYLSPILIAFLIAGCTLASDPPPIVIVTSDALPEARTQIAAEITPDVTVIPTIPPTPTTIPTPTVPPDVLLQYGDRLRLNGYYETAMTVYAEVLTAGDSAAPTQQAEALFRRGQSAVREGLFVDAVEPLTTLITTYPDDPRVPQAYFLRGDAYLGLSQWEAAIADLQQYLTLRPGLVDSYAYERIGDAHLALGQGDLALQSYALATQSERSLVPLLALRERAAQIYRSGGQYAEALAQYDAILSVAQNPGYRADIDYRAGTTLIEAGNTEDGLARLRRVFDEYPQTQQAYDAMAQLDAAGINLSDYERGIVAFNYGDYLLAIEAFNDYTTQVVLAAVPVDLYLYLGRAYREIGNPDAAGVAFRTIIDQYPQSPEFGEALLEQGRTLFVAGDNTAAIEQYLSIADNYNYLNATAAEALWRAGYLYGITEQPELSAQTFERLADAYPNTEETRSGLLLGASTAYGSGNLATAERLYARLTVSATGEDQAAAYFWLGQLALQRGETSRATQALQQAVNADPDSYFAARAQDIVNGVGAFQSPANTVFAFDDAAEIATAEAWLRERFQIVQDGVLWQLSPTLQSDPRLIRGVELWQLAAYSEAETEFFELINALEESGDALGSYQIAVYLRSMGAYYPSIFAAANVIRLAGETTLNAPPFIARMRYPAYYLDVILEVSGRRNVDPLLLFSLIRQESLFNTNATAAAGEKGLMQVIPGTAQYIAQQIQWEDYQHSDLFRPYAGVEFGGYYLQEQLERFNGNVQAALAGYNAGPGRSAEWLRLSGGDPDLFMTTITIDSTRRYVQLIYRNYNIYRVLYGSE